MAIENKFIDINIYKVGNFRFLGCNKMGKDNELEFYEGNDYEIPNSFRELFLDCMVTDEIVKVRKDTEIISFTNKKIKNAIKTKITKSITLNIDGNNSTTYFLDDRDVRQKR